ncbi:MAG: ABC transporter permease [Thermodesulfobacteriota bacterium]
MAENIKITYSSKGPSIEGVSGAFLTTRLMWREIKGARGLVWRLFIREFSARYRQSVLGVLWALFMPLVMVGFFVGMNRSGILNIEEVEIPYPLYAIIGLTIWNVFAAGLTSTSQSLVGAGGMVSKINFPKAALILAATGQSIAELLIRIILITVVFIYFGVAPSPVGVVIGLACLLPIYLFMAGIGFIMALVAGVLRDIANILSIALMGFMLLTPVVYPIRGGGVLAGVNLFNPLNYMVNVPRDFLVKGETELIAEFLAVSVLSLIVFYVGWRFFYLAQTKIAERI